MLLFIHIPILAFLGLIPRPGSVIAFYAVHVAMAAASLPWDCVDSLPHVVCKDLADSADGARLSAFPSCLSSNLPQVQRDGNAFSGHGSPSALETINPEMLSFVQLVLAAFHASHHGPDRVPLREPEHLTRTSWDMRGPGCTKCITVFPAK